MPRIASEDLLQWYASNRIWLALGLCLIGGVVLLWSVRSLVGSTTPELYGEGWYYDLNTGEYFVQRIEYGPTIDAPSGALPTGEPAGVRVWAFACQPGVHPADAELVVLEAAHPAATADPPPVPAHQSRFGPIVPIGSLTRRIDEENWSPRGLDLEAMIEEVFIRCAQGQTPTLCIP